MSRIPYTMLARELLMKQGQATTALLDSHIKAQGFEPSTSISSATLNNLVVTGEVTRKEIDRVSGKKRLLFTATDLLGKVTVQKVIKSIEPEKTPEGVLMLQSIIGNIRAGAACHA